MPPPTPKNGEGGDAGDEAGADAQAVGAQEQSDCIIVLRDNAQSYIVLQEHINDPDKPEGGRAGNQNAFDKQCQGSLGGPDQGAPGGAPGNSENAPGQAQGQGQENANANGPAQNPGQAPDNAQGNDPPDNPGQSTGQGNGPPTNSGQGSGQGSKPQ